MNKRRKWTWTWEWTPCTILLWMLNAFLLMALIWLLTNTPGCKADARANVAGNVGAGNSSNQAGGDLTMLDSKVAMASVSGLVILSLGLAMIYRSTAKKQIGAAKVGHWLIRELEVRRDGESCNCGKCADCIVRHLKGYKEHPLASTLGKMVKRETG